MLAKILRKRALKKAHEAIWDRYWKIYPDMVSFVNGYPVYEKVLSDKTIEHYYCDTNERVFIKYGKVSNPRPCPKCQEFPNEKGHDPCIANLPGVKNACCGHGVEPGYIAFDNGKTKRFFSTEDMLHFLKEWKKN